MSGGADNDNSNNNSNADMLELSSALARLDEQWSLEQSSKKPGASRWTKLVLKDDEESDDVVDTVDPLQQRKKDNEDFVYLLEPPNKARPNCVLVFTGGAFLGSFPQVAYNELLLRLSDRLGAAVVAAPYNVVGLDHFALAKRVGELNRHALQYYCKKQDDNDNDNDTIIGGRNTIMDSIPTYCVAHSLGCKLSTIYMAATGIEYDGVAFLAFNNFGFGQTVGLAKEFAQQLQSSTLGGGSGTGSSSSSSSTGFSDKKSGGGGGGGSFVDDFLGGMGGGGGAAASDTMNTIFSFAENLLGTIGIEFTPNPSDTERLIALRYSPERQKKTRLVVFEDDTLDSTPSFLQACRQRRRQNQSSSDSDGGSETSLGNDNDSNDDIVQVSTLPGTHLTPVYFKLGWEELVEDEDARNVAREVAQERLGGFESASFGSEEELQILVDEVVGFVLGKGPTRPKRPMLETSGTTGSSSSDGAGSGGSNSS